MKKDKFIPRLLDPQRWVLFNDMSSHLERTIMSVPKVTETDEVISHSYQTITPPEYDERIEAIKKQDPIIYAPSPFHEASDEFKVPKWEYTNVCKVYITILYAKDTGKISVSRFEVGYVYGHRRRKHYPLKKNTPILCYSDKLYAFPQFGRNTKRKVMPVTGSMMGEYSNTDPLVQVFAKKLYNLDHYDTKQPMLPITLKYYEGAADEYEVIEKRLGITIPKKLRKELAAPHLYRMLRVLRNKNEITTLNMWAYETNLKNRDEEMFSHSAEDNMYKMLAQKMLGDSLLNWLIRDWIQDHITLGKKLSLSIRSKSRIEDEHRKMSREIIRKQTKPIKVHKCYIKMFKKWPIENSELILTIERLKAESAIQDHCVASYAQTINAGACAIISILYNDKRWTLQVNKVDLGNNQFDFRNQQLKGYRNQDAPMELHNMINDYLASIRHSHVEEPVKELQDLPF